MLLSILWQLLRRTAAAARLQNPKFSSFSVHAFKSEL